jgi:hypothetical protein
MPTQVKPRKSLTRCPPTDIWDAGIWNGKAREMGAGKALDPKSRRFTESLGPADLMLIRSPDFVGIIETGGAVTAGPEAIGAARVRRSRVRPWRHVKARSSFAAGCEASFPGQLFTTAKAFPRETCLGRRYLRA